MTRLSDLSSVLIYKGIGSHITVWCNGCSFLLTGAPSVEAAVQIAEWHRGGLMQSGNGLARPRQECYSKGIINQMAQIED